MEETQIIVTEVSIDDIYMEIESQVSFWIEPPDLPNGIFNALISPDGYDILSVTADDGINAEEWQNYLQYSDNEKNPTDLQKQVLGLLRDSHEAIADAGLKNYTVSTEDYRAWIKPQH